MTADPIEDLELLMRPLWMDRQTEGEEIMTATETEMGLGYAFTSEFGRTEVTEASVKMEHGGKVVSRDRCASITVEGRQSVSVARAAAFGLAGALAKRQDATITCWCNPGCE
jgi:hypothetical protein